MKKRTFAIFVAYIWVKTLYGLAFHPSLTSRQISRRPVLLPVVFSPILGLIVLFAAGRIAALLITIYGFKREIIAFFLSSTLISTLLWQALILYLLGSLILTFLKNNKN